MDWEQGADVLLTAVPAQPCVSALQRYPKSKRERALIVQIPSPKIVKTKLPDN